MTLSLYVTSQLGGSEDQPPFAKLGTAWRPEQSAMIFLFSSHPQGLRLIIPVSFGARELGSSGSPPHFGVPVLWDNLTHKVKLALNLAFCFYLLYVCEDKVTRVGRCPGLLSGGLPASAPAREPLTAWLVHHL